MQVITDWLEELAKTEPEKPAFVQRNQEREWLRGWYVKAKDNRPQRTKTTHVKRRTRG